MTLEEVETKEEVTHLPSERQSRRGAGTLRSTTLRSLSSSSAGEVTCTL